MRKCIATHTVEQMVVKTEALIKDQSNSHKRETTEKDALVKADISAHGHTVYRQLLQ